MERILAGVETRSRMAGVSYGCLGTCEQGRTDPSTGVGRRHIQRRDAVAVDLDPADRRVVHGHPHVMVPDRSRYSIRCRSRGPSFGLVPRVRRDRERENGATSYRCERVLVSGFGAPDLHAIASA